MKPALDEKDIIFHKSIFSYIEKKIHPSDEISLSYEDDLAIQDLWSNGITSKAGAEYYVPCDLFMSNNIPLPNVKISVDERGLNNGHIVKFEVRILPSELTGLMKQISQDKPYYAGIVIVNEFKNRMVVPFALKDGVDTVLLSRFVLFNETVFQVDDSDMAEMKKVISMLSTWYGIQIALLSPQTKTCFRGFQSEKQTSDHKSTDKHQKRKTEYIRKVFVKRGEIHRRIENHKKRHTLSWYVIGHWRRYKSGKMIFINGYWKGILKNLKQNLDEGRDRNIIYGGSTT